MRIISGLALITAGISLIYFTYKRPNKFLPTGNARAYLASIGLIVCGLFLIFDNNFHIFNL